MQIGKPSFFKILLGDFFSGLYLPQLFVEAYRDRLPARVSLVAAAWPGKSWAVRLERSGEQLAFADGWPGFVKETRLGEGDFVVFSLMEDYCTFQVRFFDTTCCDKQISSSQFSHGFPGERDKRSSTVEVAVKEEIMSGDESEMSYGPSQTTTISDMSDGPSCNTTTTTDPSPSYTTTNSNPTFSVILPSFHNEKIRIPRRFVDRTGIASKSCIPLMDVNGRQWEIKIQKEHDRFVMAGEWTEFRRANRLAKGYLCTFELAGSLLRFRVNKKSRGRPGGVRLKQMKQVKKMKKMKQVNQEDNSTPVFAKE